MYFIINNTTSITGYKILGASGLVAISRIIGFIVIAIGIQYISSALINILKVAL